MNLNKKPYKRVFIKLSGESLGNPNPEHGVASSKTNLLDLTRIRKTIKLIKNTHQSGLEIAIMSGGGNIARGRDINGIGLSKPACDQIGMLATLMNSLVLYEYLQKENLPTKVMTSLRAEGIFESFSYIRAREYLQQGNIVILAGGSGKPLFTTDTAAVVLAVECGCEAIFKLTKVDGIYSKDPKHSDAKFYKSLSINEAIKQNLHVMDSTAFMLCQQNSIPIHICNMNNLKSVVENIHTQVSGSVIFPDNKDTQFESQQ